MNRKPQARRRACVLRLLVAVALAAACAPKPDVPVPGGDARLPASTRAQIDAAIAECRERPRDPAAFERLGRIYHANALAPLARRAYEVAVELGSSDPRTVYLLGLIQEDQGHGVAAIASFRRALASEPSYAPAWHHLGRNLREDASLAASIDAHRRATELAPGEPSFHTSLGAVLRQAEKLSEAESSLRRALALDPDDVEAHQLLGRTLLSAGREDEAQEHLSAERSRRTDVVADPWLLEVQRLAASLEIELDRVSGYLEDGRISEALQQLVEIGKNHPDRPEVWRLTGTALVRGEKPQDAVQAYRRALTLDPEDAMTHAELARVLIRHGRADTAEEHARRALAHDPEQVTARIVLAGVELRRDRPDEALREILQALAARDDLVGAHVLHAEILGRLGDFEGTAAALTRAVELDPSEAYVHRRLGEAYELLQQPERARDERRIAAELEAGSANRR